MAERFCYLFQTLENFDALGRSFVILILDGALLYVIDERNHADGDIHNRGAGIVHI